MLIQSDRLQIPPYPTQAVRLTQLLEQEDFWIQDVVDLVKADQALSAQVLRYSNSATSGLRREVTSLARAITFMGIEQLLSLACIAGLHPSVAIHGPLAEVRRAVWSRTVMRAQASEMLAKHRGIKSDMAFLCGLLCDFGKVVAIRCIEHFLSAQPSAAAMPARFWIGIIQIYEAEIGLIIAHKWRLPDALQEVMRLIAIGETEGHPLVECVVAADQVVGVLRSTACVMPSDLEGGVRLRDDQEREHVLNAIPGLVESAARLCPESTPSKRDPKSKVADDASEQRWETYPVSLVVEVKRSAASLRYQSVGIAFDGLMMEGREQLPLQELIRLVVHTPKGNMSVFGNVVSASAFRRSYRLSLRFFAMSREQKVLWDELVAGARDISLKVPTRPNDYTGGRDRAPNETTRRTHGTLGSGEADSLRRR